MPAGPTPKAFVALLLVLESGTLATFAVLDLLLFFLAFEMVLIPMYFLIARWGGEDRQRGRLEVHPLHPARLRRHAARPAPDRDQGGHLRHGGTRH